MGCTCLSLGISSCTTAPITERRQLKLLPESKLNMQAAQIYEKVKRKEKLIKSGKEIESIRKIGKKMEFAIGEYFYKSNLPDPTVNFDWEYILIDNKKIKNAWCMPGGKIGVYTGILEITKNTNGLAAVMGHEIAHAVAKHSIERASRGVLINTGTQI
jgi:Putative Zn-dependent protease, contains TPR repeats